MLIFSFLIDRRLAHSVKPFRSKKMSVISERFAYYRFADLHRGVEAFVERRIRKDMFDSRNHESLESIIHGNTRNLQARMINKSGSQLCAISHDQKEAFSSSRYWSFLSADRSTAGIIRLSLDHAGPNLEVAMSSDDLLAPSVAEILDLATELSVYRNGFLQIGGQEHIPDDYEYGGHSNGLSVMFKRPPSVNEEDIIFDPAIRRVLERNVVSFLKNHKTLGELGLPLQRGVLLYGPPGTGKSFTSQFLYTQLQPITMITVTGKGLGEVRSVCAIARMLQPAILLLEDVDLIFASREINLYSSALGEMLDELDAFKRDDCVMFLMTTNAIERLEQAIKDRPGRVSQCVYLGPPNCELRVRYLERFLRDRICDQLSIAHVAKMTEGASQAFLEELVYRAVQIAAEQCDMDANEVSLADKHFEEAVAEMTQHATDATGAIIGFGG
ncbi:putative ATPase YjoB [Rubripirellula tenax]|uniref:Putative ATPase YjoB n=1 Tax=Rubripirellula tenax TaxID=2528015 RepID=A0A5C6FJR9_9BACT|nr:ATP-binding protein [Rubripirellula tenax]TWU60289.1 putative ATPase YjoB [Rubripirellula tenax]